VSKSPYEHKSYKSVNPVIVLRAHKDGIITSCYFPPSFIDNGYYLKQV